MCNKEYAIKRCKINMKLPTYDLVEWRMANSIDMAVKSFDLR